MIFCDDVRRSGTWPLRGGTSSGIASSTRFGVDVPLRRDSDGVETPEIGRDGAGERPSSGVLSGSTLF